MLKIIAKISFILLIIVFLLMSFNLFLIKLAKPGKAGYQLTIPNSDTGFFHNSGMQFYDKKYDGYIRINKEGFRNSITKGNEYANATFIFGDSMLDLLYANRVLPNYYLEKKYNERFINASCMSYSNIQEYLLFKKVYEKYHFKRAVFFIYDGNDPIDNFHESNSLPSIKGSNGNYIVEKPKRTKKQTILWHSILYSIYFAKKCNKIQNDPDYWNDQMFGYVYKMKDEHEMFNKTAFILEKIIEYAKTNKINIKFYILPNIIEMPKEYSKSTLENWQKNNINMESIRKYFQKLRNDMSTTIVSQGIVCIDLTAKINELSSGKFYNKTNYHLTPEAFKILIDKGVIY
ncbi:hypothetical protein J7L48_03830 [bacterium]|nr:hypothetical protein [bacterium]